MVTVKLTPLRIDSLSRKYIELPQVGCTSEDVTVKFPVGEGGLLVRTISLIGSNVATIQVDEEDEFIPNLNICHLTLPKIVQSSNSNPFQRGCVLRYRKKPPQDSSARFPLERLFGRVAKLDGYIARAWRHPAAAGAGESHDGQPSV